MRVGLTPYTPGCRICAILRAKELSACRRGVWEIAEFDLIAVHRFRQYPQKRGDASLTWQSGQFAVEKASAGVIPMRFHAGNTGGKPLSLRTSRPDCASGVSPADQSHLRDCASVLPASAYRGIRLCTVVQSLVDRRPAPPAYAPLLPGGRYSQDSVAWPPRCWSWRWQPDPRQRTAAAPRYR